MKHKILSLSFLLTFSGLANAGDKNGDLKSSATIQATCLISASPIGFGAVATPLMMQSTQNDMTVKCSNASAYTIELAYGGIYGQGNADSGYSVAYSYTSAIDNYYNVYNDAGALQGAIACGYSGKWIGKVGFTSQVAANLYGYNYSNGDWQSDTKGACTSNNTPAGTFPSGWNGSYNASGKQPIAGKVGYAYGVMNGLSKGDKLAYSIQVPGEPSKVWNVGANSYKGTGNGDNQAIPMIAKIVPDKSGSKYPAPDMYLDTVTAVISY